MKKLILILVCAGSLLSCEFAEPLERLPVNNPTVNVKKLFDIEDCTMYKFRDNYDQYFLLCKNPRPNLSVATTVPNGKSTRSTTIPTEYR